MVRALAAETAAHGQRIVLSYSHRVSQAQGMVSTQAACTISDALDMMKDRAALDGLTLEQIATGVLDRRIRFGES
jgi:hypothetical protein